ESLPRLPHHMPTTSHGSIRPQAHPQSVRRLRAHAVPPGILEPAEPRSAPATQNRRKAMTAQERTPPTAPRQRTTIVHGERITRVLLAGGVVGPLLFMLVFLIEGATRPGYSVWRHFVSQLSLSDQGWEQGINFLGCGALCIGFALGLRGALRGGTGATWGPILFGVFGLSLISAGIFVTGPALGYPPGAGLRSQESVHAMI